MKCNTLRLTLLALGLVSISAWAQPALAVPTTYFDRDDNTSLMTSFPNSLAKFTQFTSSLASFGLETADTLAGPNPGLTFGATGITATSFGVLPVPAFTYQIGAQALVELETVSPPNTPAMATTFNFNQHITAFGLYVIQGGDNLNNNPTTFRLRDTVDNSFVDVPVQVGPGWGENNVFFLGIKDTDSFNEVSIIETGDVQDGMLYDNLVAGNVPEPGSSLLMTLGACALRFARRRRA